MAKKKHQTPDPEDTQYTDEPICPYCGHRHSAAWEWQLENSQEEPRACESCGREFIVQMEVTVTYSTHQS